MKRPTLTTLNTFAIAVGSLVLMLAMSGCGTMVHPMSDGAVAGIVPSGRGAP